MHFFHFRRVRAKKWRGVKKYGTRTRAGAREGKGTRAGVRSGRVSFSRRHENGGRSWRGGSCWGARMDCTRAGALRRGGDLVRGGAFCSGGLGFWYAWEKYFSELATFAGFPCYIDIVQQWLMEKSMGLFHWRGPLWSWKTRRVSHPLPLKGSGFKSPLAAGGTEWKTSCCRRRSALMRGSIRCAAEVGGAGHAAYRDGRSCEAARPGPGTITGTRRRKDTG